MNDQMQNLKNAFLIIGKKVSIGSTFNFIFASALALSLSACGKLTADLGDIDLPSNFQLLKINVPTTAIEIPEGSSSPALIVFGSAVPVEADMTWTLQAVDSTNSAVSDFVAASGTLHLKPGDENKSFVIQTRANTIYDRDRSYTLTVDGPRNIFASAASFTVIVKDDETLPVLSLSSTTGMVLEGTSITIPFTLSHRSSEAITMNWSVSAGTATAGTDFTPSSGTLTIPALQSTASITINTTDDGTSETDETVIASFSDVSGATFAGGTYTATILDDDTPLSLTINQASAQADPTGILPVEFDVVFNHEVDVTTLTSSDFIQSGSATGVTWTLTDLGDHTNFKLRATAATTAGTLIPILASGRAMDNRGNSNVASTSTDNSVTYDNNGPTVTLSSLISSPTNTSPVTVKVEFNKVVSGLTLSDIVVTNGTASALTQVTAGREYTFQVTPSANGTVTVNFPAGGVTDAAGNLNSAATAYSFMYDTVAPTVSLTSSSSNPTNTSPIQIEVEFLENVTGLGASDFTIVNGSITSLTGTGKSYVIQVTPSSSPAVVEVTLNANAVTDLAGNNNAASSTFTRTYNNDRPTVTLTSAAATKVNTATISVTVSFSASVTGFVDSDITLTNATLSSFTGSGTTYTFNLTAITQGDFGAQVAANVAQDVANNLNQASSAFTRNYDTTAPTVSISTTASNPTGVTPIPVTITFSEAITGFTASDVVLTNGTLGAITSSGNVYSTTIIPTASGTVTAQVGAGTVTDGANNNTASSVFSIVYDNSPPTVTISSTATSPTRTTPIPVKFLFNEDVSGFALTDLVIGNGSATNLVQVSASEYTVDVTPTASGAVTVDLPAARVTDSTGNNNTAATQFSIQYDGTKPNVTLTTAAATTNANPILVNVAFNEAVSGFALADLVVTGGTGGNFNSTSTSQYSLEITPSANGTITVNLPANSAQDAAGNGNNAATQLTIVFDNVAPSAASTLAWQQSSPYNSTSVTASWTKSASADLGSQSIQFFSDATCSTTSGSPIALTSAVQTKAFTGANGSTYTYVLTSIDTAGNQTASACSSSMTIDTSAPANPVFVSSSPTSPSNSNSTPYILGTAEAGSTVRLYSNSSCATQIGTGSAAEFATPGIQVTATANATTTVYGRVADTAGNLSACTLLTSYVHDNTAPVITFTNPAANSYVGSTVSITGTCEGNLTVTVTGDVTTPASFACSSGAFTNRSITLTAGDGTKTVSLQQTDAAGNASALASRSFVKDTVAPTVTIEQASGQADPASALPILFTATFSEAINTGSFTAADITQNGTATGITWNIVNSGNNTVFTVRATGVTGGGTLIPTITANKVTDVAGNNNTASTSTDNSVSYDPAPAGGTIAINSGAGYTKNAAVTVNLYASGASQMYISESADCSGTSTWISYATSRPLTLTQLNTTANVSVKYRSSGGTESACVATTIVHDDVAPSDPSNITMDYVPASLTRSPRFNWTVSTDATSGIRDYRATVYDAGTNAVVASNISLYPDQSINGLSLSAGTSYYIRLKAVDRATNESGELTSSNWTAVAPITLTKTTSITDGSLFGYSVDFLGDMDGDGRSELGVGRSNPYPFTALGGSVIKSTGNTVLFRGPASGESRVSRVGDVNGDGKADVIFANPTEGGFLQDGQVALYSGVGTQIWSIAGSWLGNANMGLSVSYVTDYNADGKSDVIAFTSVTGKIYSGASSSTSWSLPSGCTKSFVNLGDLNGDAKEEFLCRGSAANFRIYSQNNMGFTLVSTISQSVNTSNEPDPVAVTLGDLNGDGKLDYALRDSAYSSGTPASVTGRVLVFSGADHSLLGTIRGEMTDEKLGYSVSAIGDINADGVPDLAISGSASGMVFLYSGANFQIIGEVKRPSSTDGANFGRSTVSGEDMDGDGFMDLVVGSENVVHIYRLPSTP